MKLGTAKQLSVLFGLVVGYVVAIFMGKVDFSGFANLQVVSVPHFMPFQLEFDPGAIISFALLYVVSSVEVLGVPLRSPRIGLDRRLSVMRLPAPLQATVSSPPSPACSAACR